MIKKIFVVLMLVAVVFGGVGCGFLDSLPSKYDDLKPGDSVLYDMATAKGVNMDTVVLGVSLLSAASRASGAYSAEQGLEVINELDSALDKSDTYFDFGTALFDLGKEYPGVIELSGILKEAFMVIAPIKPADHKILKNFFADRRAVLQGSI